MTAAGRRGDPGQDRGAARPGAWRRPRPTQSPERAEALRLFAANLEKAFYGFEPDFFQQNLLRIVDDVISVIKGSIEFWPTLVEICYFQKRRKGLPQCVKVKNQELKSSEAGSAFAASPIHEEYSSCELPRSLLSMRACRPSYTAAPSASFPT